MNNIVDISSKDAVTIELWDGGNYEIINGYTLSTFPNLYMFANFVDWSFSGIIIANPSLVVENKPDNDMIFFDQVIKSLHGKTLNIPKALLEAKNFKQVFEYTCKNNLIISIEGLGEDDFGIVKVFGVSDESVMFKDLSSNGRWSDEANWVKIPDITRVNIFDPYCVGLEKFFENK